MLCSTYCKHVFAQVYIFFFDCIKNSRLIIYMSQAILFFFNLQGTKAVQGLTLELPRLRKVNFNSIAFIKMQRLRLLQLDHVRLTGDYKYLSKELRWLRWHGFPLKFMPNNFYPRNLVVIDLQYSNLRRVWEVPKVQ